MTASFHQPEERDDHAVAIPTAPDPNAAGPWKGDPHANLDATLPFDVRHVLLTDHDEATMRLWARVRGSLPADPLLAACAQAMASDLRTGAAAAAPLGSFGGAVSLDHAMWFHRQVPADDWFLVDIRPQSVASGRGLVVGTVHGIDGRLAATFAQEALVRAAPD
jgi:acyl-CoA thioesterase-2